MQVRDQNQTNNQDKNDTSVYIPTALEYYDKNNEKYESFFKKIYYYKIIRGANELEYSYLSLYDENKNEIFRSRYENIGLYNNKSRTWAWAWSIPRFAKNTTTIARKIVNYGMELPYDSTFLKTELITSRFRITDLIQLDMHIAIASYLSKKPLVFHFNVYPKDTATSKDIYSTHVEESLPENEKENFVSYYMFLLDENTIT